MTNQTVLALPSFRKFWTDFLFQTLQYFPVVMLVNRLAWRNTLPTRNALTDQILMSDLTCLASIGRRDDTIPLRDSSLVYGSLINLDCSSSYDPRKKFWRFLTSSSSSWQTKTHHYFCPSVTKPSPNLRKIRRHVQVPTQEFAGMFHTAGLTWQRCASSVLADDFVHIFHVLLSKLWTSTIVNRTLFMSDSPKALKNMFSSMALPSKTVLSISCVYYTIFQNFEAKLKGLVTRPISH